LWDISAGYGRKGLGRKTILQVPRVCGKEEAEIANAGIEMLEKAMTGRLQKLVQDDMSSRVFRWVKNHVG